MSSIVQCFLVFSFLFTNDYHRSTAADNGLIRFSDGNCFMEKAIIGATFRRTVLCNLLTLNAVNFTETSQELFDSLADGLKSLSIFESSSDRIYLACNLTEFHLHGTFEATPKLIINEDTVYKLEDIALRSIPQLPDNINKLHSLKSFWGDAILEENVDFTIFSKMMQLEKLVIINTSRVTIPVSLKLPSLRQLTISDSPMTLANDSSYCGFPNLESLYLKNNSLLAIPSYFSNFTSLTNCHVTRNKLTNVSLDVFADMKQLDFLSLSDNQISKLSTGNRLELPRLRCLHLTNNNLEELDVTRWTMPALEIFSLRNNRLKQVADMLELCTGNGAQYRAEMVDNPWDCAWVKEMAQKIPAFKAVLHKCLEISK